MGKDSFWGVRATGIYLVIWLVVVIYRRNEFLELSLNSLGDFFAGVVGPIALLWLVLGYRQQGKELVESSEALRQQADELKSSVEQQKNLVLVTREQLNIEVAALDDARKKRQIEIRPLFDVSKNDDELTVTVKNLGYTITDVRFVFSQQLTVLNTWRPRFVTEEDIQFHLKSYPGVLPIIDMMAIEYTDADQCEGRVEFEITAAIRGVAMQKATIYIKKILH